jgi:hypothetical protein
MPGSTGPVNFPLRHFRSEGEVISSIAEAVTVVFADEGEKTLDPAYVHGSA